MLCTLRFRLLVFAGLFLMALLLPARSGWSQEQKESISEPEPELVIVKYGSVVVKSATPEAKVFIDDIYKGRADSVIESITVGEHVISCRAEGEDQAVWGTFQIRKNETLKLEARFDEGKLAVYHETLKTVEVDDQPEPARHEKPKKAEVKKAEPKKAEPKKAERKNPVEERRKTHLTVVRLDYDVTDTPDVRIEHAATHAVSRYTEKKNHAGKYYKTKQGILLCDVGPCELTWSVSFVYTDETGKADAVLLNWKETVFNGITPTGTSKQELELCLNGQCSKMQSAPASDAAQDYEVGRYRLSLAKTSVAMRRTDVMKEILDAGRSLADY